MNDTKTTILTLAQKCAALLDANRELLAEILPTLSKDQLTSLDDLLDGGGSVGIESTVNRNGTPRICLVGIEQEGARLSLATISLPAPHGHASH